MLSKCRVYSLQELSSDISTSTGVLITDNIRFFHGDGPAQQFEAGQHIGGTYFCIGCSVLSTRADDIAYSFRCHRLSMSERQEFILKGSEWKKGGINPLDNLKVQELREEILARG